MHNARRLIGTLYVQVIIAVMIGMLIGFLYPNLSVQLQPLGDGFVKLIKMVFAPIIFATAVLGIAKMDSIKDLGRVGIRALLYFEIMSSFALVLGLVLVNIVGPGHGMNIDPATLDTASIATYTSAAKHGSIVGFLLHAIPDSVVDAFAKNEILQIILFSVLLGVALARLGKRAQPVLGFLESFLDGMYLIVRMVMRVAPLAAFGAMAFTVGKYGFGSVVSLAKLMATMYLTCILFVLIVLGGVVRMCGFSIWKFLKYIKEEILTVLGTSSSESVLPQLMRKMEYAGCSKPVVGLVIPSGLTFNPDGQCIYFTMAAIFIAQATNTPLSAMDQMIILGILMLTSKGSAGVAGAGFITLAATLASIGTIPVAGMVLLLGVDRFMAEARSITNTIGNAVGTLAIARWVGALDRDKMTNALDKPTSFEDFERARAQSALLDGDDDGQQTAVARRRIVRQGHGITE